MILAITKNNENLIYDVCKKNNLGLPQIITGIDSLYKFAVQDLKSLSNYKAIIIDVCSTKEKEEDIVKAVVAIKSMYNVRIIILALGYKEGNSLLAKLFNEGIYNFVNGIDYETQIQQFRLSFSKDGNQYKDAVRFRGEIANIGKDSVIIKREYKTLKQYVSIGIAGTEKHIGVTTQCLLIAQFFNSLGMRACYICGRDEIENLEVDKDRIAKKSDNLLVYRGIDLYSKNKIPMLILPYNISKEEVEKCAEISRDLDKPIFIEPDCGYDVEKYAEISEILKTTAPNIAIVWSIDSSCGNFGDAYPKNSPVDWVGVDIKSRCNEKGLNSQLPNAMAICRYFSEKPIMLNISVSHFSTADRKYYLEDAVNEMSVLYNIVADFKGVSAVNYISYSELNEEGNNYKLSENSKLLENYKYCTDLLNVKKYFSQVGEVGYLINEKLYVNSKTAERLKLETTSSKFENLKCVTNFNIDDSTAKVFVKSKKM